MFYVLEQKKSSDQSRIIEQPKFTYCPLGKGLEKQIKTIEHQRRKQVEALKVLKPDASQQDVRSIGGQFPKEI